jgi:short-subunit dehydrogenase
MNTNSDEQNNRNGNPFLDNLFGTIKAKLNPYMPFLTIFWAYAINLIKILQALAFSTFFHLIGAIFRKEKSFYNEIVLITGSGGYLGRNLALEFAKRNAVLVLWDLNGEENLKTNEELKANGYENAHLYTVDVSNEEQVRKTVKAVKEKIGNVSVCVMAAAPTFKPKSTLEISMEDVQKHFTIGYASQLWLIQELLIPMITRNNGHFVTISSACAFIDMPLLTTYASFKLAQTKLIETVRQELLINKIDGVRTTVVFPSVLTGGLASGFEDSYEFDSKIVITGPYAAKKIVSGIAKNKENIFIPEWQRYATVFKYLMSPRFTAFLGERLSKINSKYLKLQQYKTD